MAGTGGSRNDYHDTTPGTKTATKKQTNKKTSGSRRAEFAKAGPRRAGKRTDPPVQRSISVIEIGLDDAEGRPTRSKEYRHYRDGRAVNAAICRSLNLHGYHAKIVRLPLDSEAYSSLRKVIQHI